MTTGPAKRLRLLTFNLWWGSHYQIERLTAVVEIVSQTQPDLIAFQEVSPRTVGEFETLFQGYKIWPRFPGQAGTVIMTKDRWMERGQLRLESFQGRELVWLATDDLLLATVHLESRSSQALMRMEQLKQVFEKLAPYKRVVLMGDFNFAPDWVEQAYISSDFLDAWTLLRAEKPGFTEDTAINLMRLEQSGKEKRVRFDRVFCKGDIQPVEVQLVGTSPLPQLPHVWPSDHFGLLCDLEIATSAPRRYNDETQLKMLGRHYTTYGETEQRECGKAVANISVGATPDTPSMAAKAKKSLPNEDGLLVSNDGTRYLLAVADGHYGIQTSHALLNRLSKLKIAATEEILYHQIMMLQKPELMIGAGSALLVAVVDTANGEGFGVSIGDCTLAVLSEGTYSSKAEANNGFFYFNNPPAPQDWNRFRFHVEPNDLLLLHTDGVNECHYRCPETSIQADHVLLLWNKVKPDTREFSRLLTILALEGVGGNPGGEDNIALIALHR